LQARTTQPADCKCHAMSSLNGRRFRIGKSRTVVMRDPYLNSAIHYVESLLWAFALSILIVGAVGGVLIAHALGWRP